MEAVHYLLPDNSRGYRIHINTDNQASAWALQTGRCTDLDLGLCSRQLWLMAAIGDFELQIVHKAGSDLVLADALSRAHISSKAASLAAKQCAQRRLSRVRMTHSQHIFSSHL